MKAFHGTTVKNALAIIAGETEKETGIWSVSDNDGAFYFYPSDKIANNDGIDEDDEDFEESVKFSGINTAKWHGQSATACSSETLFCVLEMEIPDHLMQDDYSCDNMADSASFIDIDKISEIQFLAVHVGEVSQWDKPGILSSVIGNPHFTTEAIDPALVALAETLQNVGCDFDRLNEMELEEFSPEEFNSTFNK